jgi:hypothetical protein
MNHSKFFYLKQFILSGLILFSSLLHAQDCANCKRLPRVASYDLNVQVAKPSDTGEVMFQWRQLFWLSKFANSKLFELNKNCVRFIQPMVKNKEGQDVILVGETSPMLPDDSDPSDYGDYLITGTVTQSGNNCSMHLELQTTCGRKKVAAADIPFNSSSDPNYIEQIAHQAASQLSPLIDKINAFAKKEREENVKVAYSNWGIESITIKPKKRKLASGEETEIEISMKDCDGYVLANRRIDFSKGSINGMPINGTTGGTVTPSVVTTDGQGKAKAKFKMGGAKTAIIAAHYLFNRPSGCLDAMIGSCAINGVPIKVSIEYELEQQINVETKIEASSQAGSIKLAPGAENTWFNRYYKTTFYHYRTARPSPDAPANMLFFIDPHLKDGSATIYETEYGFFHYIHIKKEGDSHVKGTLGGDFLETDSGFTESNYGKVRPAHTTQFALFKGDQFDPMYFGVAFNFTNEGEEEEIGTGQFPGSITISKNDPDVKVTVRKINDPDSPYKTEYIFEMDRNPNDATSTDKLLGTNIQAMADAMKTAMGMKDSGREYITVKIVSPY